MVLFLLYLLCVFHGYAPTAHNLYAICAMQQSGQVAVDSYTQTYPGSTRQVTVYQHGPIPPLTAASTPRQVYWHAVDIYTAAICGKVVVPKG